MSRECEIKKQIEFLGEGPIKSLFFLGLKKIKLYFFSKDMPSKYLKDPKIKVCVPISSRFFLEVTIPTSNIKIHELGMGLGNISLGVDTYAM